MKFFSRTSKPVRMCSPSGSKTTFDFGLDIDSEGNEHLIVIGEKPIYEIIQASFEGACISNIITRWRAGDTSVLQRSAGVYGDFTDLPTNLADSHKAVIKAQNLFNSLPLNVREEFGMNLNSFLNAVARGDFSCSTKSSPPQETIVIDGIRYNIEKEASNES